MSLFQDTLLLDKLSCLATLLLIHPTSFTLISLLFLNNSKHALPQGLCTSVTSAQEAASLPSGLYLNVFMSITPPPDGHGSLLAFLFMVLIHTQLLLLLIYLFMCSLVHLFLCLEHTLPKRRDFASFLPMCK